MDIAVVVLIIALLVAVLAQHVLLDYVVQNGDTAGQDQLIVALESFSSLMERCLICMGSY